MKKLIRNDVFIGGALALAVFLVYLRTMAPSVVGYDCGELAAVASTLGIAHPTGYPLFTLLGWAFTHLPFGNSPIWKLNLMATLECSLAVFFFYRLFLLLLSEGFRLALGSLKKPLPKKGTPLNTQAVGTVDRFSAAMTVLILAFSTTYWTQAVSLEVYSLHLLLLSIVLLLFTRSLCDPNSNRKWYLFAFTLGLSFTNHMTTVLLAPGFLYLHFALHGFSRASWNRIAGAILPFLAGLSLYLYLPLRALQMPVMNWGDPATFTNFWWHLTAKQYRFTMFTGWESAASQARHFVENFPSEFGYAPLLLVPVGIAGLFRQSKRMLIFTLLLFLGCLFYSVNYDIVDIDSYFLLAHVTTAFWIASGIRALLNRVGFKWKKIALAACAALVALPLVLHFGKVDQSRDYAEEDYVKNLLGSLDSGAVLFNGQGDFLTNPAFYFQLAENIRPDVTIVDYGYLQRSWYYQQLERRSPAILEDSRIDIQSLLDEFSKYQNGLPYDPKTIVKRQEQVFLGMIRNNHGKRPVYVTYEVVQEFPGLRCIPDGLVFRPFFEAPPFPPRVKEFQFRPLVANTTENRKIRDYYAGGYANQGLFRLMLNDRETGVAMLRKSLEIKPDLPQVRNRLTELGEMP